MLNLLLQAKIKLLVILINQSKLKKLLNTNVQSFTTKRLLAMKV